MSPVHNLEVIGGAQPRRSSQDVSVSAFLKAQLDNGTVITVLNDRGWSINQGWSDDSVEEIMETAPMVVGPYESYGERLLRTRYATIGDLSRKF